LKEQLETRFSRDDTSPTAALLQLVPRIICAKSSDGLVDKLLFYEDDLPRPTSLQSEVNSWQRKWSSIQEDARPDNFAEAVKQADGDFYPNIRKLLLIGCTLPVGSCEAERSFSFFRRIKTCLRNNMGETRLSALSLMGIHYARTVDINEVVDEFIRVHPRRLFDHSLLT